MKFETLSKEENLIKCADTIKYNVNTILDGMKDRVNRSSNIEFVNDCFSFLTDMIVVLDKYRMEEIKELASKLPQENTKRRITNESS